MTLLSRLLVLTDRGTASASGRTPAETSGVAAQGGTRAVILREKDLPREQRRELGLQLGKILRRVGGVLLRASGWEFARELAAAGVHLSANDPQPAGTGLLVGRSCHDAPKLARATTEKTPYVTLSPVLLTLSKPGRWAPATSPHGRGSSSDVER